MYNIYRSERMKIYVVGPVGSGKSTLAKRISKELDILYVELDSVTVSYTHLTLPTT